MRIPWQARDVARGPAAALAAVHAGRTAVGPAFAAKGIVGRAAREAVGVRAAGALLPL
jgi:hypothetical protein